MMMTSHQYQKPIWKNLKLKEEIKFISSTPKATPVVLEYRDEKIVHGGNFSMNMNIESLVM